jgi:DNA-binding winged helix-turn-helix (wHTH) protein/TolB-like protein
LRYLGAVIRFGAFELDPVAGELRRSGKLLPLTGQPMRVLVVLADRAGEIVTREELQRAIWGDETHVDFEAGLSTCINQIRAALGDRASSPRFIETLPRRGYRFVAPIQLETRDAIQAASGVSWIADRRLLIPATVLLVAMTGLLVGLTTGNRSTPIPIVVTPVQIDTTRSDLGPVSISLTDALIGTLASEAGARAKVASPLKVKHLRGRDVTLQDLSALGAEYFVDVALRSLGDQILVHAKLAHISGWILWTSDQPLPLERLEREQLTIAAALAKRVASEILPSSTARRAPLAGAVGDYAQGMADLDNGRIGDSLAALEKALAADANHPGTLAGLAEATLDAVAAGMIERQQGYLTAARHARRALDLDPTNPRAIAVLRTTSN